jgi:hypothetical protein
MMAFATTQAVQVEPFTRHSMAEVAAASMGSPRMTRLRDDPAQTWNGLAWEEVLRIVRAVVTFRLRGMDREVIDDCEGRCLEVLLSTQVAAENPTAYVRRLAANKAVDVIREVQRARRRSAPLDEQIPDAGAQELPDPRLSEHIQFLTIEFFRRGRPARPKKSSPDCYTIAMHLLERATLASLSKAKGYSPVATRKAWERCMKEVRTAFRKDPQTARLLGEWLDEE